MVNNKHMIILGGQDHPLTKPIHDIFSQNWRICHIDENPIECDLSLQPDQQDLK